MSDRELWRRLPTTTGDVADLLAGIDALLAGLELSGRPAIRWSRAKHPALILGSSQRLDEIDWAVAEATQVTVHKRRSGGGAVYADDGLLWLDVALPKDHRLHLPDMTQSYRWFGEVWATALAELGLPARVIDVPAARELNASLHPAVQRACYGGVSPYEVLVGDRKIVGLAQVRRHWGAVLQSGIYLHWQPDCVSNLLLGSPSERSERTHLLRDRAIGLHDVAGSTITIDTVIEAWEHALVTILGVRLVPDIWSEAERAAAAESYARYAPLVPPSPEVLQ
jgi:lipoate-protein ligase A